jgi:signal transduction histidine kinase
MQLHVAVDQLPDDSPARPGLDRVLQLIGQVVEEGRNTLRGLRASVDRVGDLESSFSSVPQEVGAQSDTDFRVIVEGTPTPLRPVIRDDVYSIGREALVNAFRHSGAATIEVELEYRPHELRMQVRDNGRGIDPQVLYAGRDGHWGLSGMRERAERIGAKLKVWSSSTNGTEVDLRVPGRIAFGAQVSGMVKKSRNGKK